LLDSLVDITKALTLFCELKPEKYQVNARRPPKKLAPRPSEDALQDDHFLTYLDILQFHEEKPFTRLTTVGTLEFLTATTEGNSFLHFGQQSEIFSFSKGRQGILLTKAGEQNSADFLEVWGMFGPKVFIALSMDGPWEDIDTKSDSLVFTSFCAASRAAHTISGVLALFSVASKDGKIFRLITSGEIQPITELQKRVASLSNVHILGRGRHAPEEAFNPGGKIFQPDSYTVLDPIVRQYGTVGHTLCTEPLHNDEEGAEQIVDGPGEEQGEDGEQGGENSDDSMLHE
jgi:hypothetical protein